MQRDSATFCLIGTALFGAFWQSQAASELSVAVRTVQRWASGSSPVPEGVWADLAVMCREHGLALQTIGAQLTFSHTSSAGSGSSSSDS